MKMEVAGITETLVCMNQSARRYIPADELRTLMTIGVSLSNLCDEDVKLPYAYIYI